MARVSDRMRCVPGGLALREQNREHNPALRISNLDHPSGFLISHASKGQHTIDQLERVPMGRLEAVNLSADVVEVALVLGPEVEEEPLHAPDPPVGIFSPKDLTRNNCFMAAAGWVRWCSSTRHGTGHVRWRGWPSRRR